jgi:hypothetical protein
MLTAAPFDVEKPQPVGLTGQTRCRLPEKVHAYFFGNPKIWAKP